MYANQNPEQTQFLPTRLKLMLAVPLVILVCHLLFLAFASAQDPTNMVW